MFFISGSLRERCFFVLKNSESCQTGLNAGGGIRHLLSGTITVADGKVTARDRAFVENTRSARL